MALKMGDNKGVAAVEFAITLPLLLIILFGVIEFSALFFDKAVITNASREGARAGIVYRYPDPVTEGEIQDVAKAYCDSHHLITFGGTSLNKADITATWSGFAAGDSLTVTVPYRYDFLILPNFITALTGGIDLTATTVMRME